jgi:cytidylate kinase
LTWAVLQFAPFKITSRSAIHLLKSLGSDRNDMERPVITISGLPGSGKTTTAKRVAEELKINYWSPGSYHRKMADERGITLQEYFRNSSKEENIKLDSKQCELAKIGNFVLDGRYSGLVCYRNNIRSLRIWLDAPKEIRTLRIGQRDKTPIGSAMVEITQRENDEVAKAQAMYGLDFRNAEYYSLNINSKILRPEAVVENILDLL